MIKIFKTITFLIVAVVFANGLLAQEVKEEKVSIKKMDVTAYVGEYKDINKGVFDKAVKKYFDDNVSSKDVKYSSYRLIRGSVWKDVSADKGDIYYKIDHGRKSTKLYIAFSKSYDNFINSQTDPETAAKIQNVLMTFQNKVAEAQKEEDIKNYTNNL